MSRLCCVHHQWALILKFFCQITRVHTTHNLNVFLLQFSHKSMFLWEFTATSKTKASWLVWTPWPSDLPATNSFHKDSLLFPDYKTRCETRSRQIHLQFLQLFLVSQLEFFSITGETYIKCIICRYYVTSTYYHFLICFKIFSLIHFSALYLPGIFKQALKLKCKEISKAKKREGRIYDHISKFSYPSLFHKF